MRPRPRNSPGLSASQLLPFLCILVALEVCGCSRQPVQTLTLATTTSTQDSGLLDVLVPMFRDRSGIEVKVVAVGTGQALQLGRRGDADVLLVHDPTAEEAFMKAGHGAVRRVVMHNDFVLIGPGDDPAGVKGQVSVSEAFARIARREAPFVSRGDESGTHRKERMVWGRAGVEPRGDWYIRAGTGMAAVLRVADQRRAYALADRATYLAQRSGLDITVLCEGDPALLNHYSVVVVNPDKHPHVRHRQALRFADFLLSAEVQKVIAEFGIDRYGQPLYFADNSGK